MNILKITFAVMIMSLGHMGAAAESTKAREVQVGINGVFVPTVFDSSSEAFVVINGVFPNGCYRWARSEVRSKDTYNHEVITLADVTPGMCIMVLVPFQKEVQMGKLATGKHLLKFDNGDGTYLERTLLIK